MIVVDSFAIDKETLPKMHIEFTMDGEPPRITAQQKGLMVRGGRPMFFTKKKVADQERGLMARMRPYAPKTPYTASVEVSLGFYFPFPKGTPKRVLAANEDIPMTRRPDIDNLAKGFLDAMTKCGFWVDDSQIAKIEMVKRYSQHPRTEVVVDERLIDA